MIVGSAIGRILDGITISVDSSDVTIKYTYGNQDALDKFIELSNRDNARKYPLIFYVTNTVKPESTKLKDWVNVSTTFVIMGLSLKNQLSDARTEDSYIKYIEPVYNKLVKTLRENSFFVTTDENPNKYSYIDAPNYGIIQATPPSKVSGKSAVSDFVDARIVTVNFKIKTNCV